MAVLRNSLNVEVNLFRKTKYLRIRQCSHYTTRRGQEEDEVEKNVEKKERKKIHQNKNYLQRTFGDKCYVFRFVQNNLRHASPNSVSCCLSCALFLLFQPENGENDALNQKKKKIIHKYAMECNQLQRE